MKAYPTLETLPQDALPIAWSQLDLSTLFRLRAVSRTIRSSVDQAFPYFPCFENQSIAEIIFAIQADTKLGQLIKTGSVNFKATLYNHANNLAEQLGFILTLNPFEFDQDLIASFIPEVRSDLDDRMRDDATESFYQYLENTNWLQLSDQAQHRENLIKFTYFLVYLFYYSQFNFDDFAFVKKLMALHPPVFKLLLDIRQILEKRELRVPRYSQLLNELELSSLIEKMVTLACKNELYAQHLLTQSQHSQYFMRLCALTDNYFAVGLTYKNALTTIINAYGARDQLQFLPSIPADRIAHLVKQFRKESARVYRFPSLVNAITVKGMIWENSQVFVTEKDFEIIKPYDNFKVVFSFLLRSICAALVVIELPSIPLLSNPLLFMVTLLLTMALSEFSINCLSTLLPYFLMELQFKREEIGDFLNDATERLSNGLQRWSIFSDPETRSIEYESLPLDLESGLAPNTFN